MDLKYPEPDPNKKPAAEVWNQRYAGEQYLFGKEPVVSLKTMVGVLRPGKALEIAVGEGRNAVFLAQKGFQVEGVDASSKAIEKAKKLAQEKNVSIDVKTQNLDFFLMPLMKYDTIVMTYYKPQARFFSEIRRGLVHGGTFLLEAYTVDHLRHQKTPNPLIDFDQCFQANEILPLLRDFHVLYYRELPDGESHTVQLLARKVGK